MLIRSQDRKCIVVLNSITALAIRKSKSSGKFDIAVITSAIGTNGFTTTVIATYSTEAKAIKVMDMIQKTYLEHRLELGGLHLALNTGVPTVGFIPPKVFQMPVNTEVEV